MNGNVLNPLHQVSRLLASQKLSQTTIVPLVFPKNNNNHNHEKKDCSTFALPISPSAVLCKRVPSFSPPSPASPNDDARFQPAPGALPLRPFIALHSINNTCALVRPLFCRLLTQGPNESKALYGPFTHTYLTLYKERAVVPHRAELYMGRLRIHI